MEPQETLNQKTKLIADTKEATKLVRFRTTRDICINDQIIKEGVEIELSEKDAEPFLVPIEGPYTHAGYASSRSAERAKIVRLQRLN